MISIKPVTEQELQDVFSQQLFRRRLLETSLETRDEKYEVGFQVVRGIDGKAFVGKPLYSQWSDINEKPEEKSGYDVELIQKLKKRGYSWDEGHIAPFINFHMHLPIGVVSETDLETIFEERNSTATAGYGLQYDHRPLSLIGLWQPEGQLEVLVLQQKQEQPMTKAGAQVLDEYIAEEFRTTYAHVEDSRNNQATAEICNARHELRAALLYYDLANDEKSLTIAKKELEKLRPFAYAPKMISARFGVPLSRKQKKPTTS